MPSPSLRVANLNKLFGLIIGHLARKDYEISYLTIHIKQLNKITQTPILR